MRGATDKSTDYVWKGESRRNDESLVANHNRLVTVQLNCQLSLIVQTITRQKNVTRSIPRTTDFCLWSYFY